MSTLLMGAGAVVAQQKAPSYPLVTHHPYFSIWSSTDTIMQSSTRHWTGTAQPITGVVTVDGVPYTVLGSMPDTYEDLLPAAGAVKYLTDVPSGEWTSPGYNDQQWKKGAMPFSDNPAAGETGWRSNDLFVRRSFDLGQVASDTLYLKLHHDDNVTVHLNGKEVFARKGWNGRDEYFPIALDPHLLQQKNNLLAIHVKNTAGGAYLSAGLSKKVQPAAGAARMAIQESVEVHATQTVYQFRCGPVQMEMAFISPLLMDDLMLLSRPVTYLACHALSADDQAHDVRVQVGVSTAVCVNNAGQPVEASQYTSGELTVLKAGTKEQPVLKKKGDDIRIDWGYMYVATSKGPGVKQWIADRADKTKMLVTEAAMGKVGRGIAAMPSRVFLLGYDDLYAVEYFGKRLKAWWKNDASATMDRELKNAMRDYGKVLGRCMQFDEALQKEAAAAGGKEYARLCELAYRQAIAAHTLVRGPKGELLFLSKENFSNGCINTVDITYPSAPMFLLYNPDLLKGMMTGIFEYSESGRFPKPFAAHDLGTYPIASGQVYGEDMPVEESGNMLILTGAVAKADGNASYAKAHWKTLTTWAEYLLKAGFDPENQLCTDDFAGHLAHNTNLSLKAIAGIRSYAMLADMLGHKDVAKRYTDSAQAMATNWMKLAADADHYRLAFDKPGSWSQKYNLVWDRVLGFKLFPASLYEQEVSWYLKQQQAFGLPLDSRKTYTKSDWIVWTATLASTPDEFRELVDPIYKYVTETATRVPLSDWHETTDGKQVGFQARSVVGGYFMKMLDVRYNGGTGSGSGSVIYTYNPLSINH
ncbi:glutaminase domain-containing protein [Chitinophaga sp. sic0106]|uniref:glutaminase domain-containing protein n=1 Tax=Chitinophaga sp. sic0106 TaxID=2854785 RepID=UPI002107519B|nr:DUF4965 domain-containing protein [Chitinophaga sp. sic0106]